jgi:WD40 repeat protein
VVYLGAGASESTMVTVWDDGAVDEASLGVPAAKLRHLVPPASQKFSLVVRDVAYCPRQRRAFEVADDVNKGTNLLLEADLRRGTTRPGPALPLEKVAGIALSSDCSRLAVADGLHALVLWDLRSRGALVRRFDVGNAQRVAFGPGDSRLTTITTQGTVSLWDIASGSRLGTFQIPQSKASGGSDAGWETAFAFDGRGGLWTATSGGRVIEWDVSARRWLASACRATGGALTRRQWSDFVSTPGRPSFTCGAA